MSLEIIILAGGFGTRLKSVVEDKPKCLAPINNEAFLAHLIKYLVRQKVTKINLSLGYKSDMIIDFIEKEMQPIYPKIIFDWVIEDEPLGTGGAIHFALSKTAQQHILICNGNRTLFQ